MSCFAPFGKSARKRALQEENEWLKTMLSREQLQRQQAQAQAQQQQRSAHEYQLKCALLEAQVVHAAQAAHELGEQMCMFLAHTEHAPHMHTSAHITEAAAAGTPWSLYSTSKHHALRGSSPDCAATPRIAAFKDQDSSSSSGCRAFELTPGGNHSVEPLRMQERMARLSVHLKGMAAQWRSRLETCGDLDPAHEGIQAGQCQQAGHSNCTAACEQACSSDSECAGSSSCGSDSGPGSDGVCTGGSSNGHAEEVCSSCDGIECSNLGRALDEAALAGTASSGRSGSSLRSGSTASGSGSRSSSSIGGTADMVIDACSSM